MMNIKAHIFKERGVTLIEILVALALIAFVSTVALPVVTSIFGENLKSSSRKLAGTIKYVYNQAIMKNKTMRLVYDFKENKYWAEITSADYKLKREDAEIDVLDDDEEEEKASEFSQVAEKLLKPRDLDRGVKFKTVTSIFKEEPVEGGKAYTHFFPNGFVESTVIHLQQDESVYSLVIEPMLGIAKIYDYLVEPDFEE